jgi:hypothetical protein
MRPRPDCPRAGAKEKKSRRRTEASLARGVKARRRRKGKKNRKKIVANFPFSCHKRTTTNVSSSHISRRPKR